MPRRCLALAALCCSLLQPALARDPGPVALPDPFDASALKGVRRVAVPQFSIEFVASDHLNAETSGLAAANLAQTNAMLIARMVSER